MKAEKRGGNSTKMATVKCTICGMEHYNYEALSKLFFLQGTSSMPGLLISTGMPPEFLDELAEGMRGAKKRMGERGNENE